MPLVPFNICIVLYIAFRYTKIFSQSTQYFNMEFHRRSLFSDVTEISKP